MKESTRRFFQLMNEANEKIAAHEAEQEKNTSPEAGDPVRVQRMAERREKQGQLRARPHPRSKTGTVRSVFPYVDPR